MRIGTLVALLLMLALPARAQNRTGTCTTAVQLNTSAASVIFPAFDVSGGRHYMLLQCVGSNNCFCTMGRGVEGTTISTGVQIGPGGNSWTMQSSSTLISIPVGEVDCISSIGAAAVVGCDW